jgi:predicted DNA-binding protein (MmcQ/YjbR family)
LRVVVGPVGHGPAAGSVAAAVPVARDDDRVDDGRMTVDELLAYCLAKPEAWRDEPWESDTVVKVGPKIFAFLGSGESVGVKCGGSREEADEWLARYPRDATVLSYIGRSGWNALRLGGAIPDDEVQEAVDVSYHLVVAKLPKKDRPVPG